MTVNAGKDSDGKNLWNDSCVIVDVSLFSAFSSVVDEATTKGLREEAMVNAVVTRKEDKSVTQLVPLWRLKI